MKLLRNIALSGALLLGASTPVIAMAPVAQASVHVVKCPPLMHYHGNKCIPN